MRKDVEELARQAERVLGVVYQQAKEQIKTAEGTAYREWYEVAGQADSIARRVADDLTYLARVLQAAESASRVRR